tara:strand:+ start:6117 stop:6536 length:420 start_codon:yes stop_codon:yes gene_type:complete
MANKIGNSGRRGIKESILKLRREGKSVRDISKILTCSKSTINYHFSREGLLDIGLKNKEVTDADKVSIFEYTQTHTIKEAISKFGFGRTTIIRYMARKDLATSDDVKKQIIKYRETHTTKETAKEFGVSSASVNRYNRK